MVKEVSNGEVHHKQANKQCRVHSHYFRKVAAGGSTTIEKNLEPTKDSN
jgi:hypothetical protein